MISADQARMLVRCWGLDAGEVEYPEAGTMNDVVIVATDADRVVLRGHRRREVSRVEFEHEVMHWARSRGVPVPHLLVTSPAGTRIVEHAGRLFSLAEYAKGRQIARELLAEQQAVAMGRCLAQVHSALGDFPTEGAPRASSTHSYAETVRQIEELLDHIARAGSDSEQEQRALLRLRSRADWMRGRSDPPLPDLVDQQLIHGDFQDTNLFFAGNAVSSVIDWDKAEVGSRGQEVLRTMQHSFNFDPNLCGSFVAGYRSCLALDDEALAAAAVSYGHRRDCDLWLYRTVFLDGDERPRRFLRPGPFVPFPDLWEPVARAIGAG